MDITTAKTLAAKLQISMDLVIREEYEMILLKEIFESEFGTNLVFKGGTALRLAYGSARFSEDLDFNLISAFETPKFFEFLKRVKERYPFISAIEAIEKFNTIFALVKIKELYLERVFSIKIEISKRAGEWVKGKDYVLKVIRSEATPLTVLVNIASLAVILREKKDALKNRKFARDSFDYWFIGQLLHKELKPDFSRHDKKQAKAELHKLLPRNFWRVSDTWLE